MLNCTLPHSGIVFEMCVEISFVQVSFDLSCCFFFLTPIIS